MVSKNQNGWLALVATPIGNLEDITLRARRFLEEADIIAAEDTRRTRKLCSHFDIHTSLISYHAHNEHKKTPEILDKVVEGQRIAVVTDAGTPGISDPGFLIVREALKRDIEPIIVPGPSSLTFAVLASGFPVDQFTFLGYPPRKTGQRRRFFEQLVGQETTFFIFASVHRIDRVLEDIADVLGPRTRIAVIREATKVHEERLRGAVEDVIVEKQGQKWRGEFVIALDMRNSPVPEK
ncbi:MAG: 16S rRNA (cytidine(1402)-2'-O)-methyltransferase [Planctomycetes bacterium]|nr:16S rRNA (cytidine(1402)-2'-O)-methyltransferase [Planctomycetota bacterium]